MALYSLPYDIKMLRMPRACRLSRAPLAKPLSTAASNPLLLLSSRQGLPDFAAIKPEHIEPAVDSVIFRLESDVKSIVHRVTSGGSPSWSDILDLEAAKDPLERVWAAVGHLNGVANSEALRKAYAAALPKVVAVSNRLKQDQDLYKLNERLLAKLSAQGGATPGQIRTLQWAVKHAQLAGVALPAEQRAKLNDLLLASSSASQRYDNNVIDSTAAFKLQLSSAADVDGLPDSLKAQYAAAAVKAGLAPAGATAESGPWLVTLDFPSFRPFLQHSKRRDLREQLYRAHISRASAHGPGGSGKDNSGLVAEILHLRSQQASLLGYRDFAHVSLASKMAPSATSVMEMMSDLRTRAFPAAQRELGELNAFAQSHPELGPLPPAAQPLAHWDVPFWSERMLETRYGVNEEELRCYFPLYAVLEGMWSTLSDVFGVQVRQAHAQKGSDAPSVWHEHASFWTVYEGGSEPIASFYLDPYSRLGSKRGGAWMDVAVGRTTNPALISGDGSPRKPVAFLTCNQPAPVGDGTPSLMRHSDVLTLWHEFGHGAQHMLTRVGEGDVAGISGVEW